MTELQRKQFEILKDFVKICDKLDLTYYLVCGSALGTVKYGGFIPWDDDIDVAMPRGDYEIFIEKAKKLLPEHIFLQNYKTESRFPQIYSKLRDSNTTYIEKSASNLPIHHGVFIDIFPLDGYPKKKYQQKVLEIKKRFFQSMLMSAFKIDRKGKSKILFFIYSLFGIPTNTAKVVCMYEKCISKYCLDDSMFWCNHGNWQGKLEYAPKWQYGAGLMTSFEGLKVRIPVRYDDYLTQKYGDWRKDLPEKEQVGHHYYDVCDLEKSYIEYFYQ